MAGGFGGARGTGDGLGGVVAALADGMMVIDGSGRIRFANPAACELFGRPLPSLIGADFGFPVQAPGVTEVELLVGGATRVVEMRSSVGRWGGEAVVVLALRDITAKTDALARSEEAALRALHDPLTGLPGRSLLLDRIDQALARSERSRGTLTVLFVDLDDFKALNDHFGHETGDRILRALAARVKGAVRPADTVCRLGGDEFVVVCEGVDGRAEADEIAARVEAAVAKPYTVDGQDLVLTASVGIALATPGAIPETLVANADAAMYLAKQEGKARHHLFDETMREQVDERARLEAGLQVALEAGRLRLVYQPILDLETADVIGAEALLRYDDPDLGTLSGESFISTAEASGLLVPVGTWALEEACRQAARWLGAGRRLPIAVNLGPAQLAVATLESTVRAALASARIPPDMLCLEVAEATATGASGASLDAAASLTADGVQLGIDDWGAGPSSVTALACLPVSYVKLDRSVVAHLSRDLRTAEALVGAIVALGLTPLAQGIESTEQLRLVRAIGCTAGQGYHLAPPGAPEELLAPLGAKRVRRS